MAMILLSLIAHMADESIILNCAKLHSESKYFGSTPLKIESMLLVLLLLVSSLWFYCYLEGVLSSSLCKSPNSFLVRAANEASALIEKIWIVPLSEEHAKYLDTGSKAIQ